MDFIPLVENEEAARSEPTPGARSGEEAARAHSASRCAGPRTAGRCPTDPEPASSGGHASPDAEPSADDAIVFALGAELDKEVEPF
eukprot:8781217-Heterocapsa_arctica.AAC.1